MGDGDDAAPVRLTELLAALSLGIDLGFAQPMEHVLRQCRIALRLSDLAELDPPARADVHQAALLVNVGCHSDAHEQARWFGDDIALKATKYVHEPMSAADVASMLRLLGSGGTRLHRLRVAFDFALAGRRELDGMIAGHARLARSLGEELGLPPGTVEAVGASYERWDGKGYPGVLAGTAIPVASRIVQLAEFMEVAHRTAGVDGALDIARRRSGSQFDPALVALLDADAEKVFLDLDDGRSWEAVIDAEPVLAAPLDPDACDAALSAISRFVDLKSPYTLGHSVVVAGLAGEALESLGAEDADVRTVRRAALVARFGCLGISNAIWDKPGPLTSSEWERVRLHPYLTERMLHQAPGLARLGGVATQVRERLDGSGYPRGLTGDAIDRRARVLAAADVYQSMVEPRPHRPAREPAEAAVELRDEVRRGRLDADAVEAVLGAAGHRAARRRAAPDGLTAREVEVLQLVARGCSTKEVARRLVISPKTAGRHIEHIYAKIGASTRAAAGLYAVRHGLLPEEPRSSSG